MHPRKQWWIGVGAALVAAFAVYGPSLTGPFFSDDFYNITHNVYVTNPSPSNLVAIATPGSAVTRYTANFAPVQLYLHALQWQLFGAQTAGYHVSNVLVHVLASVLLVAWYLRCGFSALPAAMLGAAFLLHPANVEAVAWIFQLKTSVSLALCLGALIVHERRPAAALLLFALALCAKPTAAVAFPVLLWMQWVRRGSSETPAAPAWLWGWGVVLGLFSATQFAAFGHGNQHVAPIHPDFGVRMQTVLVIALRYLVMAYTARGVSTFHEPEPILSLWDPELLAAVVVLSAIAARFVVCVRKRRMEAALWGFAAVSFAPVSQVFPFLYPMADRYLYFLLPGLLGGAWLWFTSGLASVSAPTRLPVLRVAFALGILALGVFGYRSHERAGLWRYPDRLVTQDAALNYPEGRVASLLAASRYAQAGDVQGVAAALNQAVDRGFDGLELLLADPAFAGFAPNPSYRAVLLRLADLWVDRLSGVSDATQLQYHALARAYWVRGDLDAAARALERGIAVGGPQDAALRALLAEVRSQNAAAARGER